MWSRQCRSSLSWKQLGLGEDFDNEVDDPSSVLEEKKQEEPPTRGQRATRRSAQRKVQSGTPTRSRSPLAQAAETRLSSEPWMTAEGSDTAPAVSWFQPRRTPRRTPGVPLETLSDQSPKDLFILFFATDTVRTNCSNTDKNAAKTKN